uniref:Uncharacterized protein n=1 Tax=uncultured Armatimonadetes bacterium TaxID=157466 RepID=A0A6J4JQU2_9BACT|nr:hypothetical protein AVDCRST_MAG63-3932 [uncultured Armatimonadetes bacterium]
MTVEKRAQMQFASRQNPDENGEIVLWDDETVQIVPSATLREKICLLSGDAETASVKWGVSLLMGLAAVGGLLFWRGRRPAGYALFGTAAVTGVGAALVRRGARALPGTLLEPHPVAAVTLLPEAAGALNVQMNGDWPGKLALKFEDGDYDPGEALAFQALVDQAKERAWNGRTATTA